MFGVIVWLFGFGLCFVGVCFILGWFAFDLCLFRSLCCCLIRLLLICIWICSVDFCVVFDYGLFCG